MISLPKKIKIEMIKKGINQASIGRSIGVTRGAVCQVISGYGSSRRIRRGIAEALEIPYEKLWGEGDENKPVDREVA